MSSVINNIYGFYFLHIPKTAGRSIEQLLMNIPGSQVIDVSKEEKKRGVFCSAFYAEQRYSRRPSSLKNIFTKKSPNTLADWHKLYKFCFVRSPYERAYSAYKYCMKTALDGNKEQPFGTPTPNDLSFSEFLRLPPNFNYEIKNHLHISQTQYMFGHQTKMDFVGKLESIDDDLLLLAKKLKIEFPPLIHVNATRTDNNFMMSKVDKCLIDSLFEDDFVNFDYTLRA
jgi:hypothetical protein